MRSYSSIQTECPAWSGHSCLSRRRNEFAVPGVTERLRGRFAATHDIEVIWQRDRRREDFPLTDRYIRWMQDLDLAGVVTEGRPIRMQWLWMRPNDGAN